MKSLSVDGVRVWAHGRTVRCASVVLAVDGYAPLLERTLARWIAPGRMLLVTTAPLSGQPLPGPCYADYGYEYARSLPDGRLLLGAWRRPRPEPEFDESLREGLDRFIARYFPEAQNHIADHRSGIVGLTPDGLPILGSLAHMPQVAFAVGFGSWGLSWALVAADRLTRRLLNGEDLGILAVERLDRK